MASAISEWTAKREAFEKENAFKKWKSTPIIMSLLLYVFEHRKNIAKLFFNTNFFTFLIKIKFFQNPLTLIVSSFKRCFATLKLETIKLGFFIQVFMKQNLAIFLSKYTYIYIYTFT